MRDDIDPQIPIVKLTIHCRGSWTHPNGTHISPGDRSGYRAVMRTGETHLFMALTHGDNS